MKVKMSDLEKKLKALEKKNGKPKEVIKKLGKGVYDGDRGTKLEPYVRDKFDLRDMLSQPEEDLESDGANDE